MFEGIISFFKKFGKGELQDAKSKDMAKERLHLVLMQDRANVSADFLEMMKQEIIDVIKKYITVDESEIDVRLTNKTNEDGTSGAPALYANIPIVSIKNESKNVEKVKSNNNEIKAQKEEKITKKSQSKNEDMRKDSKTEIKENGNTNKEDNKIEKNQDIEENNKNNENNYSQNDNQDNDKKKLKDSNTIKKETEKKEEIDKEKKNITSKKTSTKRVTKKTSTKAKA